MKLLFGDLEKKMYFCIRYFIIMLRDGFKYFYKQTGISVKPFRM